MISAVLDTGVLVSALISSLGAPAAIVRAWRVGLFELVTCPALIEELGRALAYPKVRSRVGRSEAERFVDTITRSAVHRSDPIEIPAVCSDPNDDYLFALARAADAILISGDAAVLAVTDAGVRVLRTAAFLDLLRALEALGSSEPLP